MVQWAETDDPEGDLQQTAVEAYTSEVAISAEEALRRLAIQDRFSNLRSDLVDAIEPADFGGTWIDDADGGQVKVGIETDQPTPPSSKTAAAREVLEDHNFVDRVDFVAVASSLADLNSGRESLSEDIQGITHGRVAISVDSELNSLVVRKANSLTPAEQSTLANALGMLAVDATTVETGLATLIVEEQACDIFNSLLVCDRPLRGGVTIRPDDPDVHPWCTAGFFAERPVTHAQVLITAGHCWDEQTNEVWHARNAQGVSFQIGTFQEHVNDGIDAGLINVPSSSHWYQDRPNPLGWVLQMPSPGRAGRDDYPIRDSAIPAEPIQDKTTKWQLVCMTSALPLDNGRYTACGRFVDTSYDAPKGNDIVIFDTTITSICGTTGGTSGGPYYKNKLAYGIHIGSVRLASDEDYRCADGNGNATYQKVPHIERELEVLVSDGDQ